MTKRELLSMALKVLGIWYAGWTGVTLVPMAVVLIGVMVDSQGAVWPMSAAHLAAFLLLIAFGVCVVRWSDWIARRAMPDGDEPVTWTELKVGSETVLLLAMKCLGVLVLLDAASHLLQSLANVLRFQEDMNSWAHSTYVSQVYSMLIIAGFELIMGGYLLLGGRAVACWLAKGSHDSTPAVLGQNPWERPFFLQVVRVIGIVFLVWRLPAVVTRIVVQPVAWLPQSVAPESSWHAVVPAVITVVLGLFLIFGARQIANCVFRDAKPRIE